MRKLIISFLLTSIGAFLLLAGRAQTNSAGTDTTTGEAASAPSLSALHKIAIIVQNRGSTNLNDKVSVLEDLVSSRVAGRGFSVISRDDVTRSLKNYSDGKNPNGDLNAVDRALESGTSALRLAQNLGADYILVPSLISLGTENKSYAGNGINTLNISHRLRVSYKIVEAGEGGAVRGGAFTSEKNIRQTAQLQTESSDVLNELLDDAAEQLADSIALTAKALPQDVAKSAMVSFTVSCTMTDPRQQPILISAIGITQDNRVVVTNPPLALQPMDVTVELDGLALGAAPGTFKAGRGIHKIRLSREGFDVWEHTINVYDGQDLRVALQMNNAGYARWAETTAFLSKLENKRKLTDAEVSIMEGIGSFFRNSHYKVDTAENIHVYKSLF